MCSKEEVKDIVNNAIAPATAHVCHILESLGKIESSIQTLPCNIHNEKIVKLQFHYEYLEKDLQKKEDSIEELFKLNRGTKTSIATLKEKNKGQDTNTSKLWIIIMFIFTVAVNLLTLYLGS